MLRRYSIVLYFSVVHISLSAQSVVQVIPAPVSAWGIDYQEGTLYVGSDSDGFLYSIDPSDGTVLSIISTPLDEDHQQYGSNHGVVWDGSGFWITEDYTTSGATLYKIDLNGNVLQELPASTSAVGDLGWDGQYLLVTSYYPNNTAEIRKIDPNTGDIIATVPVQGHQPFGVTFDGESIWNGMDDIDGDPEIIWELDPTTGDVLSQFDSPAESPKGLAWGEGYLWLVTGSWTNAAIYQIDLGGSGTPDIELNVSSMDFGLAEAEEDFVEDSLAIYNVGDAKLWITGAWTTNIDFYVPVAWPDSGLEVLQGDTLNLPVHYSPQEIEIDVGILTISSTDPDESEVEVSLTGVGLSGLPYPQPSFFTLNFSEINIGATITEDITIENWGLETLTVSDFTTTNSQFYVQNSFEIFPIHITTLESVSIPISFSPDSEGLFNATLTLDTNGGSVIVDCSGAGVSWPNEGGTLIWSYQGIENIEDVESIQDINGDGYHDVIIETYFAGADGDHLVALSGYGSGSPQVIWSTTPQGSAYPSGGWGNKCLKTSSDLNGDDYDDILLGTAWANETVFAVSGLDGETLWEYDTHVDNGGGWVYSVSPISDITGDGVDDVLAGAGAQNQGASGSRSIYCFDGLSGELLWRYEGFDAVSAVISPGDLNGDGISDAVGGFGGNSSDNRVAAIDGTSTTTGSLIWEYQMNGDVQTMSNIGDVDSDGINDIIAAGWGDNVVALSGSSGDLIWQTEIGTVIMVTETLPDVSGDGINEIIVGSWASNVIVLNGSDGSVLWNYPTGNDVWAVSEIPDINGNGSFDVLAGDFDGDVLALDGTNGELLWTFNTGGHKVFDIEWIPDVTGNGVYDVIVGTQYLNNDGGYVFLLEGGEGFDGTKGDVNTDGTIDIFDIVLTVSFIVGDDTPTDIQFWLADMDGDNFLEVMDIIAMVNLILDQYRFYVYNGMEYNTTRLQLNRSNLLDSLTTSLKYPFEIIQARRNLNQ
tara:strand:- start:15140 stop:18094 length:2955 start_codon:yes stop_codon:yes gene_type:complete